MPEEEAVPDDLRCSRSDGRGWRCKRRAAVGKKMCEIHHLQLNLRQRRQKVPESLKLVRSRKVGESSGKKLNGGIGAQRSGNSGRMSKRKRVMGEAEAVDEAVRKMKLKRGDAQLDLIRMALKKEVEKMKEPNKRKKKKKTKKKKKDFSGEFDGFEGSEQVLTRVLPNGVMAISSSSPNTSNAASPCDAKVGAEPISVSRRRFRSKNIEPFPVGNMQGMSFKEKSDNSMKEKKKRCHWCGSKGFGNLFCCLSCKREFFCLDCIGKRHTGSREEVERDCPICRGSCRCKACSVTMSGVTQCKDLLSTRSEIDRVLHLHYLICMLLPVLKQINAEHRAELEREAETKDREVTGCGHDPLTLTNELENSAEEIVSCYELPVILDKSSGCSFCLGIGNQSGKVKRLKEASRREDAYGNFLYHPAITEFNHNHLEHFQTHWSQAQPVIVQGMQKGASDLDWDPVAMFCAHLQYSKSKTQNDGSDKTTECLDWFEVDIGVKQLFSGSLRGSAETNTCQEKLKLQGWVPSRLFEEHFPTHYAEVLDILPIPHYMDPKYGLLNVAAKPPDEIQMPDLGPCLNIYYRSGEEFVQPDSVKKLGFEFCDKVDILFHATDIPVSTKQICRIRKLMKRNMAQDQVVDKERDASRSVNDKAISIDRLKSDNYGKESKSRLGRARKQSGFAPERCDLSHKGREASYDGEDPSDYYSGSDLEYEDRLIQGERRESCEHSCEEEEEEEEALGSSYGAQWDIFRRQDVAKLVEYLKKHSHEINRRYSSRKQVNHPLLDHSFYLDAYHKARLKEEFEIEPWTFEQHVREAVIIPAGCPYQIRKVKSCVNVVLNFVSPEHVAESIQRVDELCLLPQHHKSTEKKIEVKKMAIHKISEAVKEIRLLTSSDSTTPL